MRGSGTTGQFLALTGESRRRRHPRSTAARPPGVDSAGVATHVEVAFLRHVQRKMCCALLALTVVRVSPARPPRSLRTPRKALEVVEARSGCTFTVDCYSHVGPHDAEMLRARTRFGLPHGSAARSWSISVQRLRRLRYIISTTRQRAAGGMLIMTLARLADGALITLASPTAANERLRTATSSRLQARP